MYVITANNISKKYISGNDKNVLFDDMSLHVHEGEIVFISGDYGSGKTTLLKMIAAMTPPNHGKIKVLGKDLLTIQKRSDWRLKHIGFLTKEDSLIPYLTVKQHLLMGLEDTASDFELFSEDAKYILTMVGISEDQLNQFPESLTKVDRLKITLARVLMGNPRLLLLDELTSELNEEQRFELYRTIVEFSRLQNITIILTGENESCDIADRMLKLENGKLMEVNDNTKFILH
ncbi:hypothetical protein BKP35_17600 [Anaerobacillus arseniciselenatis]|uniref:ABC transporter domain-containing protein n=1 Tax=Anaerobacillus arseniciselenatis TaxID=85682 RepID=A0A1S2L967_9BACI|nr:ATP-binding cassette domain-containing protein [Anaerobacillus arseniciselenatis]OIJ08533.1 hypothetical protein BKP35_17600 [Anaerobacillus arseniciselenatis]